MKKMFPRTLKLSPVFKIAFTLLFLVSVLIIAQPAARAVEQVGPLDQSGELNGAPYRIRVPANWNGTLLVYVHGYRDKADHPGEVDNRNADVAPNNDLANFLLSQGYALAGTAFRDNGWAVEEGIHDVKDLAVYFRDNVAKPDRTILWGFSMGSVIVFKSMERFNGIYDGALAGCAVGAGAPRNFDGSAALWLAYDTLFGVPPSWGTAGDVRDDIDFETEVQPKLIAEVSNPLNFGRFEFIRLVTGVPGQGITAPPGFYPGWAFTDLFFATEARAELERRAGGPVAQNLTHTYTLTAAEKAYLLNTFGIDAEPLLAQMNAMRDISAPPSSRNYLERNATYSGKIKNPVLTMHTIVDPLVVVSNESAYRQTILSAGRGDLLFQTYTTGVGHCAFTGPQLLTGVAAIDNWVRTGTAPLPSFFPAAAGFNNAFVPPAFPQP